MTVDVEHAAAILRGRARKWSAIAREYQRDAVRLTEARDPIKRNIAVELAGQAHTAAADFDAVAVELESLAEALGAA